MNSTETNQPPKRRWYLTAWLGFVLIVNICAAVIYSLYFTPFAGVTQGATQGVNTIIGKIPFSSLIVASILFAVANILFIAALFRWQKWGFYGFVTVNLFWIVLNFSFGIGQAIFGLLEIILLYLFLIMGDDRKAWPHLK
jgi:hypothetical protein